MLAFANRCYNYKRHIEKFLGLTRSAMICVYAGVVSTPVLHKLDGIVLIQEYKFSHEEMSLGPNILMHLTVSYQQNLGSNAVLLRAVLENVGVHAHVLGCSFTTTGYLLQTILLPVLERLGDPIMFVSAAAESALQVVYMTFLWA